MSFQKHCCKIRLDTALAVIIHWYYSSNLAGICLAVKVLEADNRSQLGMAEALSFPRKHSMIRLDMVLFLYWGNSCLLGMVVQMHLMQPLYIQRWQCKQSPLT